MSFSLLFTLPVNFDAIMKLIEECVKINKFIFERSKTVQLLHQRIKKERKKISFSCWKHVTQDKRLYRWSWNPVASRELAQLFAHRRQRRSLRKTKEAISLFNPDMLSNKELSYPRRPFWIIVKEYLKGSSLQSCGDGISY